MPHPLPTDTDDIRPGSVARPAPNPSAAIVRHVRDLRITLRRINLHPGLTSGDHGRIAHIMLYLDQIEDNHRAILGFTPRNIARITPFGPVAPDNSGRR